MFENRTLRKIFGLKKEYKTGRCRKLHHNFYSATNIIRKVKSRIGNTGHVARTADKKKMRKRVLVRYSQGKGPLGRPERRWEDNIKMNVKETGWCGLD